MTIIEKIIAMSEPHRLEGGSRTVLKSKKYLLSIVGGRQGLYGDFKTDFELAIIDPLTNDFITKLIFPEMNDDVMAYVPAERVEEIVNMLFPNQSFQES